MRSGICPDCGAHETNCTCSVGGNPDVSQVELNEYLIGRGVDPWITVLDDGTFELRSIAVSADTYRALMAAPKEERLRRVLGR